MSVAVVTGSAGLVGAEAARYFAAQGLDVVGVDNDMRRQFFGADATTLWSRQELVRTVRRYTHVDGDIRDGAAIDQLFGRYGRDIVVVIHAAAQPSHDWAARDPVTDFTVNAQGTLVLLEATRGFCPEAAFIFCSTNKVYGDACNRLPLEERATRWELEEGHPYAAHGVDEGMTIDASLHSLFGVSKTAADLMVQEYGRSYGLNTACFRGGCLTGPGHAGAQLHGFLSYLMKCALTGAPYTVLGYKGKQVRDNIHSRDLVSAFWQFFRDPKRAAVYNMGGGRFADCSVLEAIALSERIAGRPMNWSYEDAPRLGDHMWWVSDTRRFQRDYPEWRLTYGIEATLREIHAALAERLQQPAP
ncbi:MAG TPA: NAD-dependent epimerase/dehydratase family protein [Stellaceae bacterium]|nr:NAD-dependent epimerase/dehydratase family protein [Stellaceae bacterium]